MAQIHSASKFPKKNCLGTRFIPTTYGIVLLNAQIIDYKSFPEEAVESIRKESNEQFQRAKKEKEGSRMKVGSRAFDEGIDTWVHILSNSVEMEDERAIHNSRLHFIPTEIYLDQS